MPSTAGLRIVSPKLGDTLVHPARATDDPAEVGTADAVIVRVKLWDTAAAADAIKPMLGPGTTVLSLQNGVECNEILGQALGRDRIFGGVAFIGSSIAAPGVIRHVGSMQRVVVGERTGATSPRVTALHGVMVDAGITAEISDDIERTIWEKFVFLVGLSATTTLMRRPLGPILEDPERRAVLLEAMRETADVGRSSGVDLPPDFAEDRLLFFDRLPPALTSSMHHDLERGNKLEVGWLSGAVVRYGRDLGVPTPVNRTIYAALKDHAAP